MQQLSELRAEVAQSWEPWLNRLLDAEHLAKLAQSMGLGWFREEDVVGLWSIGLLRADLVSSATTIDIPSLLPFSMRTGDKAYSYYDARRMEHRSEGYGSSIGKVASDASGLDLMFHPYRLYVLHHVERTLKVETSSTQYLLYEEGVRTVTQHQIESIRRWTSSAEFGQRFDYWNTICETAIVAEAFTFGVVHQGADPHDIPSEPQNAYEQRVRQFISQLGQHQVRQMREDLAFGAETLDENRSVHVLLRLMKPHERSKLKGRLGCAMHFLAMAEVIRRAAEAAFGSTLPEEDEIGPGQWFPGARRMLYGNDRVFDAPRRHLRDYLTLLGLDFGVKVRCYVEGATEFGAIEHAVGDLGHVQLIDLKGQFAERGGKGLTFAESLEADKKAGVFSVILLDGDRGDYVRLVQYAAKQERFTGSFFISSPDAECANFSISELIDIAVSLSYLNKSEPEIAEVRKKELREHAASVKDNRGLFDLLAAHGIADVRKDKQWGKALMVRAIEQPVFGAEDPRAGTKRPIVEAVEVILRIQNVGFQRSLARERVDPVTGRAMPREDRESP